MDKLLIEIPEGFSGIDTEKSDFDNGIIVFKKKAVVPWKDNDPEVNGFYITTDNVIIKQNSSIKWVERNHNIFATEEQARSAQAMAELSQIIAHDERFGGPITGVEWSYINYAKYVITRIDNTVGYTLQTNRCYFFLAFHTEEQARLFLEENEDLIRQYYNMVD